VEGVEGGGVGDWRKGRGGSVGFRCGEGRSGRCQSGLVRGSGCPATGVEGLGIGERFRVIAYTEFS
jgi:hypothetical protein